MKARVCNRCHDWCSIFYVEGLRVVCAACVAEIRNLIVPMEEAA